MDFPIPPLCTCLCQEDLNLLLVPSKEACPQRQGQALNAIQHCHQLEGTRLAHLQVRGPCSDGNLELLRAYVDKAGVFHLLLELCAVQPHGDADFVDGLLLVPSPSDDIAVFRQRAIVRARVNVDFLTLDPASGLAMSAVAVSGHF